MLNWILARVLTRSAYITCVYDHQHKASHHHSFIQYNSSPHGLPSISHHNFPFLRTSETDAARADRLRWCKWSQEKWWTICLYRIQMPWVRVCGVNLVHVKYVRVFRFLIAYTSHTYPQTNSTKLNSSSSSHHPQQRHIVFQFILLEILFWNGSDWMECLPVNSWRIFSFGLDGVFNFQLSFSPFILYRSYLLIMVKLSAKYIQNNMNLNALCKYVCVYKKSNLWNYVIKSILL